MRSADTVHLAVWGGVAWGAGRVLIAALTLLGAACTQAPAPGWDPAAAAGYLDRRAVRWMNWRPAQLERGTACMSCHTSLPYALSRASLGPLLHESAEAAPQRRVLADVLQRVQDSRQLLPYYYKDIPGMASASRGTEAVLNALILADEDARHGHLTRPTLAAFATLWSLQRDTGAEAGSWEWTVFDNEPWEAADSVYYGATLAALAVARAPENYRARADIQGYIALLQAYLVRGESTQTPLNRLNLLWAAQRLPGLIGPPRQQEIRDEIWGQQRPDGGWSLQALLPAEWSRHDGTTSPSRSDGFATAFVSLVMEEGGIPPADARLAHALAWLKTHQSHWSGGWRSSSPNRSRRFWHEDAHFMDDAATAFAVLALTTAEVPSAQGSGNRLAANR
jgi:squalene-hopene/tetraprenyl-beta-curcumene cyclase